MGGRYSRSDGGADGWRDRVCNVPGGEHIWSVCRAEMIDLYVAGCVEVKLTGEYFAVWLDSDADEGSIDVDKELARGC